MSASAFIPRRRLETKMFFLEVMAPERLSSEGVMKWGAITGL